MNGREEQFMSELNTRFRSAIVVVGLMLLGSLPSQAATYNFDFTSAFGYSVVGSLTTGNADGPGYDITSISGTIISANSAASGSIQGLGTRKCHAASLFDRGRGQLRQLLLRQHFHPDGAVFYYDGRFADHIEYRL